MITDLKPGDKVLLHTEAYLQEKYTPSRYTSLIYSKKMKDILGTIVTVDSIHPRHADWFTIEELKNCTGTDGSTFEICTIKEKITQEEKGNTMNNLKVKAFEEMLKMAMPMPLEFGSGKSFMMDTMLKDMTAAKPAKAKFLTLNVVNGQANVKEMIHQAYFADIIDPRPFIQDMLKRELTRLHTYLETIAPLKSNLGFNLKLRGMFETLLDIVKQPVKSMTTEDAVSVYEFQKEYDNYQAAVQANNGVCPYQWIDAHLTHDNLNTPKIVTLFASNKIQILIKNGLLIYREESPKANYRFELEIKFSVAENKFSL